MLASKFNIVPVIKSYTGDMLTPVGALLSLRGDSTVLAQEGISGSSTPCDDRLFLFESVEHSNRWGRYSFVGLNPLSTYVSRGFEVACEGKAIDDVPLDKGMLCTLDSIVNTFSPPANVWNFQHDDYPGLISGMLGYLGYDVVREIEQLGSPPCDDLDVPDAIMSVVGDVIVFDHFRQQMFIVSNTFIESGPNANMEMSYHRAIDRIASIEEKLRNPISARTDFFLPTPQVFDTAELFSRVRRRMSADQFELAVRTAKEHILSGNAFQIVLSQRFDLSGHCDPLLAYRYLRQVNPSPYMFVLANKEVTLVGSSPEPLVKLQNSKVISRPIAGTRRRGSTIVEDQRLGAELKEDPKELAEHTMLVDLARNDIGRVCEFGTERVEELMTLEHYSHVMHLTSQVSGTICSDKTSVDLLRATLPAGTVSGAPKVSAMKIIDELEVSKRGPYAGVVGYLDFNRNLDTAITIRTMCFDKGGNVSVQAGAGIVADSDPGLEDRECCNKATALLAAAMNAIKAQEQLEQQL